MNPKISFVMITARSDYPYQGRPDLHLFEPTLESFKQQTMKSMEWVIVDTQYERRKDYFKNLDLDFPVKHVPAKPNLWLEKGFPGICNQYNRGIIHSDGELLFFTGDSHMMRRDFMSLLWKRYMEGYFPLAWYFRDYSFNPDPPVNLAYPYAKSTPVPYDILGYTGKTVSIEHRYEVFDGNSRPMAFAPWQWWFGCSSASLEAMLKINGFNELFDGDRMLLDCDVGSRLQLAGYGVCLAMFRDIFLIRIPTDPNVWSASLKKDRISIKCPYPLIWYSRFHKRPKANTYKLTDEDIRWIKEEFCAKMCGLRELCKKQHPWQYPFEHKAGYAGHHSSKRWFNFWKRHQQVFNLMEEREKRLNGEKYVEGTFAWAE